MANASIKAAFERFWAHVVARLGDVIDQCKEYTDTNAVKYGYGKNVNKYVDFTSDSSPCSVEISPGFIRILGHDGKGVYLATDELDSGNGYIDGVAAIGFYGTMGDEAARLLNIATPVDECDAANKEYVDAQIPKAVLVTLVASSWGSDLTQTVTATGVLADETKQMIFPMPTMDDLLTYYESEILLVAQAANSVTFTATVVPTEDIQVYICYQNVEVVS